MIEPVEAPKQVTWVTELMNRVGAPALLTFNVTVLWQLLASFTYTKYEPADNPVNNPEVCQVVPLRLYCKAPEPPVAATNREPSAFTPQVALVTPVEIQEMGEG